MKQITPRQTLVHAYLFSKRIPRPLRIIKLLCYIGIGIGSCALMLALSITHGFEYEIARKMKGINSDIIIESPGNQIDITQLSQFLTTHCPAVNSITPISTRHIILTKDSASQVLFLKGICGRTEEQTTALRDKILAPRQESLEALLTTPFSIIIGKQCALNNKLWLGSHISVHVPLHASNTKITLEKKDLIVSGIFSMGLEEYDANVAYCSRETLSTLFEDCTGADQLALSLKTPTWQTPSFSIYSFLNSIWQRYVIGLDTYYEEETTKIAALLPGLSVRSWKELYPDLVVSLKLEKYALSIVLGLIACVASMLMISLLFMFIQHKQHDIALLTTLGMSRTQLYWLFVRLGMRIIMYAAAIGITLACNISWFLQTYKLIPLPDIYYISYVPAIIEPLHVIIVFCATMLLGYAACHIPLAQLKKLSVVTILRGS
jgi:ABC-type lipoprotein release transport system permease subunit